MIYVWIAIAICAVAIVAHERVVNTEKAEPIDISDPAGEDKWGAM